MGWTCGITLFLQVTHCVHTSMKISKISGKACMFPSCPELQRLNFQTVPTFLQISWASRKMYQLTIWGSFATLNHFKFVKNCAFHTNPFFLLFNTEYSFDRITSKCSSTFQKAKTLNWISQHTYTTYVSGILKRGEGGGGDRRLLKPKKTPYNWKTLASLAKYSVLKYIEASTV